jgi:hypothetical protein
MEQAADIQQVPQSDEAVKQQKLQEQQQQKQRLQQEQSVLEQQATAARTSGNTERYKTLITRLEALNAEIAQVDSELDKAGLLPIDVPSQQRIVETATNELKKIDAAIAEDKKNGVSEVEIAKKYLNKQEKLLTEITQAREKLSRAMPTDLLTGVPLVSTGKAAQTERFVSEMEQRQADIESGLVKPALRGAETAKLFEQQEQMRRETAPAERAQALLAEYNAMRAAGQAAEAKRAENIRGQIIEKAPFYGLDVSSAEAYGERPVVQPGFAGTAPAPSAATEEDAKKYQELRQQHDALVSQRAMLAKQAAFAQDNKNVAQYQALSAQIAQLDKAISAADPTKLMKKEVKKVAPVAEGLVSLLKRGVVTPRIASLFNLQLPDAKQTYSATDPQQAPVLLEALRARINELEAEINKKAIPAAKTFDENGKLTPKAKKLFGLEAQMAALFKLQTTAANTATRETTRPRTVEELFPEETKSLRAEVEAQLAELEKQRVPLVEALEKAKVKAEESRAALLETKKKSDRQRKSDWNKKINAAETEEEKDAVRKQKAKADEASEQKWAAALAEKPLPEEQRLGALDNRIAELKKVLAAPDIKGALREVQASTPAQARFLLPVRVGALREIQEITPETSVESANAAQQDAYQDWKDQIVRLFKGHVLGLERRGVLSSYLLRLPSVSAAKKQLAFIQGKAAQDDTYRPFFERQTKAVESLEALEETLAKVRTAHDTGNVDALRTLKPVFVDRAVAATNDVRVAKEEFSLTPQETKALQEQLAATFDVQMGRGERGKTLTFGGKGVASFDDSVAALQKLQTDVVEQTLAAIDAQRTANNSPPLLPQERIELQEKLSNALNKYTRRAVKRAKDGLEEPGAFKPIKGEENIGLPILDAFFTRAINTATKRKLTAEGAKSAYPRAEFTERDLVPRPEFELEPSEAAEEVPTDPAKLLAFVVRKTEGALRTPNIDPRVESVLNDVLQYLESGRGIANLDTLAKLTLNQIDRVTLGTDVLAQQMAASDKTQKLVVAAAQGKPYAQRALERLARRTEPADLNALREALEESKTARVQPQQEELFQPTIKEETEQLQLALKGDEEKILRGRAGPVPSAVSIATPGAGAAQYERAGVGKRIAALKKALAEAKQRFEEVSKEETAYARALKKAPLLTTPIRDVAKAFRTFGELSLPQLKRRHAESLNAKRDLEARISALTAQLGRLTTEPSRAKEQYEADRAATMATARIKALKKTLKNWVKSLNDLQDKAVKINAEFDKQVRDTYDQAVARLKEAQAKAATQEANLTAEQARVQAWAVDIVRTAHSQRVSEIAALQARLETLRQERENLMQAVERQRRGLDILPAEERASVSTAVAEGMPDVGTAARWSKVEKTINREIATIEKSLPTLEKQFAGIVDEYLMSVLFNEIRADVGVQQAEAALKAANIDVATAQADLVLVKKPPQKETPPAAPLVVDKMVARDGEMVGVVRYYYAGKPLSQRVSDASKAQKEAEDARNAALDAAREARAATEAALARLRERGTVRTEVQKVQGVSDEQIREAKDNVKDLKKQLAEAPNASARAVIRGDLTAAEQQYEYLKRVQASGTAQVKARQAAMVPANLTASQVAAVRIEVAALNAKLAKVPKANKVQRKKLLQSINAKEKEIAFLQNIGGLETAAAEAQLLREGRVDRQARALATENAEALVKEMREKIATYEKTLKARGVPAKLRATIETHLEKSIERLTEAEQALTASRSLVALSLPAKKKRFGKSQISQLYKTPSQKGKPLFGQVTAAVEKTVGLRSFVSLENDLGFDKLKSLLAEAEKSAPALMKTYKEKGVDLSLEEATQIYYERSVLKAADELLIKQLNTDTDAGAFRLSTTAAKGITTQEAQGVADTVKANMPSSVNLTYAPTMADVPENFRAAIAKAGQDINNVKGLVLPTGEVLVIGENHANTADLEETFAHELIGHYSVDTVLGPERFQKFVNDLFSRPGGLKHVAQVAADLGVYDSVLEAEQALARAGKSQDALRQALVREMIAHAAEGRGIKRDAVTRIKDFWRSIVDTFKDALSAMGFGSMAARDAREIQRIIREAHKAFASDKLGAYRAPNGEVAFNLKSTGGYAEFNELEEKVYGKPTSWKDRLIASNNGLSFATKFIDRAATLFHLGDKMSDSLAASQMKYYLREADALTSYTSNVASTGYLVREEQTDLSTGKKFFVYNIKEGANLKQLAQIIGRASFGNAVKNESYFGMYLTALRAEEVGYAKFNFDKKTQQKLRDFKRRIDSPAEAKNKAIFDEARKVYREYNRRLIDFIEQSGAITADKAKALRAQRDYIPYYRVRDDGRVESFLDEETMFQVGNLKSQPYLHELVGGTQGLFRPFDAAVMNTNMLLNMGLHNQATKNTAFILASLNLGTIRNSEGPASDRTLRFKLDGEDKHIVIKTEGTAFDYIPAQLIVRGMEGISTLMPWYVRLLSIPARLLRQAIVLSPTYSINQILKDSASSIATTGADAIPVLSALREVGRMFDSESASEKAFRSTGLFSSKILTGTKEDYATILRQLSAGQQFSLLGMMEGIGMKADAASRRVMYNSFKQQGLNELEARLAAREAINFNTRGTSPGMYHLSMMIPFFNAGVQSWNTLYKSLAGKMPFNERLAVREKLMVRGMALAGMTLAYAAMLADEDWYKEIPEEQKLQYWFFKVPGVNEPLRIPIPFEVGLIFKAVPEAVFLAASNDKDAAPVMKALGKATLSMLPVSPTNAMPAAVKPLAELWANKDLFSWQDIESRREKGLDPAERFREGTTDLAKAFSSIGAPLSPVQIDHLIRGYTGGLGYEIVSLLNPALSGMGITPAQKGEAPEKEVTRMPVIKAFFQPLDGRGIINRTYDIMEDAERRKNTYNKLVKENRIEEAEAYAKRYEEEISYGKSATKFKTKMGEITEAKRAIIGDETLTGQEKYRMLKELVAEQKAVAEAYRP